MLLIFNFLISLIFVISETLSLLRNRWKLLLPDLLDIFCFWNWKKSKQMLYYIVALGIESFCFIACTLCYLKHVNVLMALVEKSPSVCSSLEQKKVNLKIFNMAVHGLGTIFVLYLRFQDDSEYLFWIFTFHIVSLLYSPSCRHDLFCGLSIVLLRHSHGNLSGLLKSKSWWSAISFGNLSTLLSLCLLL